MSQKISQQPLASRFEHLVKVISGERFLQMKGLNNDLPFYICEFKAAEALEMERLRRQLINTLESTPVACLGGRGVKVLEINTLNSTMPSASPTGCSSTGSARSST